MRSRLGPSGLIRVAVMTTLGLSLLLSGCASSAHDAPPVATEEKQGWSRCDHPRSVAITLVCFQR